MAKVIAMHLIVFLGIELCLHLRGRRHPEICSTEKNTTIHDADIQNQLSQMSHELGLFPDFSCISIGDLSTSSNAHKVSGNGNTDSQDLKQIMADFDESVGKKFE